MRKKISQLMCAFLILFASVAFAGEQYQLTNLVSDQAKQSPLILDPDVVNPWGVALSPLAGPFWVSNNKTGVATLYSGDVNGSPLQKSGLIVAIPGGAPTGVVFNGTPDFRVTNGTQTAPAFFIFVSQTGVISGWNPTIQPNTQANIAKTVPGAVYTGVALGNNGTENLLYVADFLNHRIDVFNSAFELVSLSGSFTDPEIPFNFAPFNIQNLNGNLYVAYADPTDVRGSGQGFVSVFDTNGNLKKHLIDGGKLNAPWGMTLAPADFGKHSNALLVGNFGNGRINAYDAITGESLGRLKTIPDTKLERLWTLTFGNGITSGDKNILYFSAGPDNETHGTIGSIRSSK